MQRLARSQRLARWLVEVNVFACPEAAHGRGNESIDLGFDRDDLYARIIEQSFLRLPGATLIGALLGHAGPLLLIGFDDAHDLIEIAEV